MKNNKDLKKPFFAKFLENQLSNEEETKIQGGETTKPALDTLHTLKYPSDSEDSYTKKYPSDNDEAQTMKYPSDGDEDSTAI